MSSLKRNFFCLCLCSWPFIHISEAKGQSSVELSTLLLLKKQKSVEEETLGVERKSNSSKRYTTFPAREPKSNSVGVKVDPSRAVNQAPPEHQSADEYKANDDGADEPKASERKVDQQGNDAGVPAEFHAQDTRRNILEISLKPSFVYINSDSEYWPRSYSSGSPAMGVEGKVWFRPALGVHLSYLSSFGATVKANPEGTKQAGVTHQNFAAGLRYRSFFGVTRRSPRLLFGLDYYDYRFRSPATEVLLLRHRTSGVEFNLEAQLPTAPWHFWILGASFSPFGSHEETNNGSQQSGDSPEFYRVGFKFGSQWQLNRKYQVFWLLSHQLETDSFNGSSRAPDPVKDKTLDGVAVRQSLTLFSLGLTWGS